MAEVETPAAGEVPVEEVPVETVANDVTQVETEVPVEGEVTATEGLAE